MQNETDITILGEKGQVVIPQRLRKRLGIAARTRFMVFGEGDVIVLKRLELPDMSKQLEELFARTTRPDITEADIEEAVQETRRERRQRKK